jgi:hypothetical protein
MPAARSQAGDHRLTSTNRGTTSGLVVTGAAAVMVRNKSVVVETSEMSRNTVIKAIASSPHVQLYHQ